MRGAVLYGSRDVRFEERDVPTIIEPTETVIRIAAACVCGSDLPYRGTQPIIAPTPMGHAYCGIVEKVGRAVISVTPGRSSSGSFFAPDNTCPNCQYGYQSSCVHPELVGGAQAPPAACPARERYPRPDARHARNALRGSNDPHNLNLPKAIESRGTGRRRTLGTAVGPGSERCSPD